MSMDVSEEEKQNYYIKLNSWILYTIKEVMGVDEVRNEILKYYLQTLPQHNIEYGPTFSIGVSKEKLYKYLDHIVLSINSGYDKLILFTCNNNYGPVPKKKTKLIETHYQTFIIQPDKKRITMIDPSRRRTQTGIYWPYAAMSVYFYIKSKLPECKFYWLKMTQPCQVRYSKYFEIIDNKKVETNTDVFCQSWSLFLLKEALLTNKTVIDIPYELDNKYSLLINFYHEILRNIPIFGEEFIFRWKDHVKKQKLEFSDIDVLGYIENMKGTDMYYHIDLIYIRPETAKNYVNLVSEEEVKISLNVFIEANPRILNSEAIAFLKSSFQRKSPVKEFIKTPLFHRTEFIGNKPEFIESPEHKRRRRHSRSPKRTPSPRKSKTPSRSPSPKDFEIDEKNL